MTWIAGSLENESCQLEWISRPLDLDKKTAITTSAHSTMTVVVVAQAVEWWRHVPTIWVWFCWTPGFFLFLSQWCVLNLVPDGVATLTDFPNKRIGLAELRSLSQSKLNMHGMSLKTSAHSIELKVAKVAGLAVGKHFSPWKIRISLRFMRSKLNFKRKAVSAWKNSVLNRTWLRSLF